MVHYVIEIRVTLRSSSNRSFRWAGTPGILFFVGFGNGLYDDISPILGLAKDIRTGQSKARRTDAAIVKVVVGLLAVAAESSAVCELLAFHVARAAAGRAGW